MNLNIPLGKSVVIFTSYRTGSTALCDFISKKYNLTNFDEVFHNHIELQQRRKKFLNYQGKFVIKIMPDQITNENKELIVKLIKECFIIKLTRTDVIKQIASFYICCETNKWHYKVPEITSNYKINIYNNDYLFDHIISTNQQLENLDYGYDLELAYEDLEITNTDYKIYNKPTNYVELIEMVTQKYELLLRIRSKINQGL
jgi:LPS sulfotransferase NodH